jgi:hypothetical protein
MMLRSVLLINIGEIRYKECRECVPWDVMNSASQQFSVNPCLIRQVMLLNELADSVI